MTEYEIYDLSQDVIRCDATTVSGDTRSQKGDWAVG